MFTKQRISKQLISPFLSFLFYLSSHRLAIKSLKFFESAIISARVSLFPNFQIKFPTIKLSTLFAIRCAASLSHSLVNSPPDPNLRFHSQQSLPPWRPRGCLHCFSMRLLPTRKKKAAAASIPVSESAGSDTESVDDRRPMEAPAERRPGMLRRRRRSVWKHLKKKKKKARNPTTHAVVHGCSR